MTELADKTEGRVSIDDLDAVVEGAVNRSWTDIIGATRFPRRVLEDLADHDVLRSRWAPIGSNGSVAGDVRFGVAMSEALATRAPAGVAIGVSLHTETVLALLHRFAGTSDYLAELRDDALSARQIGCIAASEPIGGSDLSGVACLARPTTTGWVISGHKKYVSLGTVADFAIVLCRLTDGAGVPTERHATLVVPMSRAECVRVHDKLGTHALDTVAVRFDEVEVPHEALVGRAGLGVLNLNYALSFERLAIAAQVAGGCSKAIALAVEHAQRREQFDKKLIDHQYIAFRLAELKAETDVLSAAATTLADELMSRSLDRALMSRIASLKLCAARAGERVISDSMQVFGGPGYLVAETPFGQFWNDIRLSRIGAGTDEMMLAIISDGLRGDPELYDRLVNISR